MQELTKWIRNNTDTIVTVFIGDNNGKIYIAMSLKDRPEKGQINGHLEYGQGIKEKLDNMKEQLLFDSVIDEDDIWAVSYADFKTGTIQVLLFDNKKAAEKYHNYAITKFTYVTLTHPDILSDFRK